MPLTDQIRDYFADVEVQQEAVDVVALFERESSRLRTVDDSGPTKPRRAQWLVGLVAAAAVVALVAGLVVMRFVDDGRVDDGRVDDVVPSIDVPTIDDGTSPLTSENTPETVPTDPAPQPTAVPVPERETDAITTVTVEWPAGEEGSTVPLLEQATTPSSIGDLRWTVFDVPSVADPQLPPLRVWRGPAGYVAVRDLKLVFSDDAVTWRVVDADFPGTPTSLARTHTGQYQLTTRTPRFTPRSREPGLQVWVSTDLVTWNLALPDPAAIVDEWVDGPGILDPHFEGFFDPANIGYQAYVDLPNGDVLARVSLGLDVGLLASRFADDDVRELFDTRANETWSVASDPDSLSITRGAAVVTTTSWSTWATAKEESLATFEVELSISGTADDWVVEVENADTGESLGTVRGSIGAPTLRETLEWLGGEPEAWIVVDGEGSSELVEPDWADLSSRDPAAVKFVTTADGLIAYVDADGDAPEVWRTTDGRAWEPLGTAGGLTNVVVQKVLTLPSGRFAAIVLGASPTISFMTSDDAVNWQPASRPPAAVGYDSEIRLTERGFLVLAGLEKQVFEAWTSPDGDVWEQVDADELISRPQADLTWSAGSVFPGFTNSAGDRGSTFDLFTLTRSFSEGRVIAWLVEVAP